jgi:heme/copper-type cytochrome/quinol oxidase subunit 1
MLLTFTIGGVSGVMHATSPHNLQQTDTYFVVAHFHYVLIGGLVLGLFGGFYYWYPKITGRYMSERLGKWQFWLFYLSFNATFFPMHWIGLLGMPRRVFTYTPELNLANLNLLVSVFAFVQAFAVLLLVYNMVVSYRRGAPAGRNPWNAATLEWATESPPAEINFNTIPTVHSREPLWLERERVEAQAFGPVEPMHMPPPSYWPIFTAVGVTLTMALFLAPSWWEPLIGIVWTAIGVINWAHEPT